MGCVGCVGGVGGVGGVGLGGVGGVENIISSVDGGSYYVVSAKRSLKTSHEHSQLHSTQLQYPPHGTKTRQLAIHAVSRAPDTRDERSLLESARDHIHRPCARWTGPVVLVVRPRAASATMCTVLSLRSLLVVQAQPCT